MSLEPGGRAEKYGDEYENRYLAKLLLRLVNEDLSSVIVEPVGEHSNSVEFTTMSKSGTIEYYQCKVSNGIQTHWSIATLQRYDVLSRAKKILSDNINTHYFFISPLSYDELDELCKRARTTSSVQDLMKYQLNNNKIQSTFKDCCKAFQLNVDDTEDQDNLLSLLSRCYFEQYSNGIEAVRNLEELIGLTFTGKPSEVRVLLEQFANANGTYGKNILSKDVVNYLENRNIHIRNLNYDCRILPRINILNTQYWDESPAINGQLIHREATSKIIQIIEKGGSVILHGKAGCGKSGCLQEVINNLIAHNILYLSVKLDKIIPKTSADEFGKALGLPESPVHCLAMLSEKSPCVLILDQLDSLRWTANHSAIALSVCKELISQVKSLNENEDKNISIVFASRTFDLENDSGLKNLFPKENDQTSLMFEIINIDTFTNSEVIQLIGQKYNLLSARLQKLLLTPSTLY